MKKGHLNFRAVFFLILSLGTILFLLARAGGGGGESNGGGGYSGSGDNLIGDLIFFILVYVPFPWNLIIIGGLIGAIYFYNKKTKQKTILNKIPATTDDFIDKFQEVKNIDPDFDLISFSEKVKHAFIKIQEAWSKQSIRSIRKFISDGLFQRFNAQFIMMKQIEQKNIITDIKIQNIKIIDIKIDGNYLVMDVAIAASMTDQFRSKKIPSLKEVYTEPFVEIWTFIRKTGFRKDANLYQGQHCPQCGAILEELESEVCQCPYCNTILNTGEFDWILSEITQIDDYPIAKKLSTKLNTFKTELSSLYSRDPYFSIQWMEDKASNAFMQILIAHALDDSIRIRRFSSDDFFESYIPQEKTIYSRLYLNFVTLTNMWQQNNMDYLSFHIKVSYRRLRILNDSIDWIDYALTSESYILILKRDVNAALPKGSIYVHQCPCCGGTLEDTTLLTCSYCGELINSAKHEWIVHIMMKSEEYQQYIQDKYLLKTKKDTLNELYNIRDYVFNNICVILASDGQIDEAEMNYINELAKKLGYSTKKINGFLKAAQKGRLKLMYPSQKQKEKVLKQMKKAAEANQNITEEEKTVLISFEKNAA
ncbi:MAG: TIM44-like domain-containing protein [Bacteroidales bacterium]|nr:TIM44-like domain-containing protein [Bacteroidales bacterium]